MLCPSCRHENPDRAKFCFDPAKEGYEMAQLAVSIIQGVADRLTDAALRASFVSWSRVQAVYDHLDRLSRG